MALTLDSVKKYLRIDFDIDDDYIEDLIEMSKSYIYGQTNVEYSDNDLLYKQAILLTVANYYDNRSPISEKAIIETPMSLTQLIKQIGMRGPINEQG